MAKQLMNTKLFLTSIAHDFFLGSQKKLIDNPQ